MLADIVKREREMLGYIVCRVGENEMCCQYVFTENLLLAVFFRKRLMLAVRESHFLSDISSAVLDSQGVFTSNV